MPQGLQILNESQTVTFDLTSRLPKYMGEADIIPTSPSSACSGEISIPALQYNFPEEYLIIDKIYTTNISLDENYGRTEYVYPIIRLDYVYNKLCWSYSDYSSDNQVNVACRIRFGCY